MPNKQDKTVRKRDLMESLHPIAAVDDDDGNDELTNKDSISVGVVVLMTYLVRIGSEVVSSLCHQLQVKVCSYYAFIKTYLCTSLESDAFVCMYTHARLFVA